MSFRQRPAASLKPKVGDLYVRLGLLDQEKKMIVLKYCRGKNLRFLEGVLELGFVTEDKLRQAFGRDFEKDLVSVSPDQFPIATQNLFSVEFMITYGVLPLGFRKQDQDSMAFIGMLTPGDIGTIQIIGDRLKKPVQTALMTVTNFLEILQVVYESDIRAYQDLFREIMHPYLRDSLENKSDKTVTKSRSRNKKDHAFLMALPSNSESLVEIQVKTRAATETSLKPTNPSMFPTAMAFRVESAVDPSDDRRKEGRKGTAKQILLSIKVKHPTSERGHRKGVIKQFYLSDMNQDSFFAVGKAPKVLQENSIFEMVISHKVKKNESTHLAFLGKIIRIDENKGMAVSIDYMPGIHKNLWNEILKTPELKVISDS